MKSEIVIKQMPAFKRAYKKFHQNQKKGINEAIRIIVSNPAIGEVKKGDLSGIYVYKFKIQRQQFLIAYEWCPKLRILIALGVHENFYRNLKRNIN